MPAGLCERVVELERSLFNEDGSRRTWEEATAQAGDGNSEPLTLTEFMDLLPPELREGEDVEAVDAYLAAECGVGRVFGALTELLAEAFGTLVDEANGDPSVERWSGVALGATVEEAVDSFLTFWGDTQVVDTEFGPVVIGIPAEWMVGGAISVPADIAGSPTMSVERTCLGACGPKDWLQAIDGGTVDPVFPEAWTGSGTQEAGSESGGGWVLTERRVKTETSRKSTSVLHSPAATHVVVCTVEADASVDMELWVNMTNACVSMYPVGYPQSGE